MEKGPCSDASVAAPELLVPPATGHGSSSSSRSAHKGALRALIGAGTCLDERKTPECRPLVCGAGPYIRGVRRGVGGAAGSARGECSTRAHGPDDGGVDGTRTRDLLRDRQAF